MRSWFRLHPFVLLLIPLVCGISVCRIAGIRLQGETYQFDVTQSQGYRVQQQLLARYRYLGIEEEQMGTLGALTLGYRDGIDRDMKQKFQAAGAMHVLAVSGLHTGILMSMLIWIFTLGGWYKPLYESHIHRAMVGYGVILLLWLYACITGWSPSVVRSVIMCTIAMLATIYNRETISLNSWAAAAFCILAIRPVALFSVSFQLSFAAVLAIICFNPLLQRVLPIPVPWLRDLLTVSISAQLGTLPFTMYYFSQFSTYFLLANIIVIPMAYLILAMGILVQVFGSLPLLGTVLVWIENKNVRLLNRSVQFIEQLPGSTIHMELTMPMTIILCVAIVVLCAMLSSFLSDSREEFHIPFC